MNRRSLLLAGLASGLAAPAFARGGATALDQTAAAFRTDVTGEHLVGGAYWISQRGRPLARETFGFADLATGRRVDADTIWHWASITKTFTAIALMQLRDQGLVALDERAIHYLPELRRIHGPIDKVTVRHLLTHTSGLRHATFPWGGDQPWHPHEPADWSQVEAMYPYTEIEFEPGSKYLYSNPGMSLVGRIVEELSGETIEACILKNILMPLGMTRSYFDLTPRYLVKDRSNNYDVVDGVPKANGLEIDTGATVGNGGLNTPIPDFAKYTDFLLGLNDTGEILSRRTLEEMWVPGMPTGPEPDAARIGLGFMISDRSGRRFIGHNGNQMAFSSLFLVHPESGSSLIGVCNSSVRGVEGSGVWRKNLREAMMEKVVPGLG
jgi:CubicO group peptidase (beta-lactamase class C family)